MPGTVELGRVVGAFGIKGWVRLRSYTDPPEGVLRYRQWHIGGREWRVVEGRRQGDTIVAALAGLEDRDAAAALRGAAIEVPRSALPKPGRGEFYWTDVLGSEVVSTGGAKLGTLSSVTSAALTMNLMDMGPPIAPTLRDRRLARTTP